jgi:hypothetical protein
MTNRLNKGDRWRGGVVALACASMVAAPGPVLAQSSELGDLVYQGEDYSARELPRRGYVLTHVDDRGEKAWEYWWKDRGSRCVRVTIQDDRVANVKDTDEHDCGQKSGDSGSMSDGAKVAIAAAAILGAAALAHKSHENDKDRAKQSPQDVAEFDRGYRDGLYHHGYHNYNNKRDYSDGYQRGSEKRDAETGYRSDRGHHSGYSSYVNVHDLIDARAASADGELRARGFLSKGSYQDGGRAVSMWWNQSTRQCLSMVVRDGRVKKLDAIVENNCT